MTKFSPQSSKKLPFIAKSVCSQVLYNEGKQKSSFLLFVWQERGYGLWGAEQPSPTPRLPRVHWQCPTGRQGQAPGRGTASRGTSGPRWDAPCAPLRSSCGAPGLCFSCPRHIPFHKTCPVPSWEHTSPRLSSVGLEGRVRTVPGERRNSPQGCMKSCLSNSSTTQGI